MRLSWVEFIFFNRFSLVESSDSSSTVLWNPDNSLISKEYDDIWIDGWDLDEINLSDFFLSSLCSFSVLNEPRMKCSPWVAFILRLVYVMFLSECNDNPAFAATPEYLVYNGRHWSLSEIHFVC